MAFTHIYAGHGGGYVKGKRMWVGVSGVWQPVYQQSIGQGGAWRLGFDSTPGPLASVQISPTSVTVPQLTTFQFSAIGLDADGVPVSPPATFSWFVSSITDSIDSSGLFSAGTLSSTPTVTVSSGGFSDFAAVTVP